MKIEKREITLNEYDSLKDAYYRAKTLLYEYLNALFQMERKETRDEALKLMRETAEDVFLLKDLMKKSENQEGI